MSAGKKEKTKVGKGESEKEYITAENWKKHKHTNKVHFSRAPLTFGNAVFCIERAPPLPHYHFLAYGYRVILSPLVKL